MRPRIALPPRRADWILEVFAALSLLVLLLVVAFSWKLMPQRVPIHYGLSGAPDAWTGSLCECRYSAHP